MWQNTVTILQPRLPRQFYSTSVQNQVRTKLKFHGITKLPNVIFWCFLVESIDNFMSEKLKAIEVSFPIIAKPTEQMYAETKEQVESIYSNNLKTKVETAKTLIKYGADKVFEARTFTENLYNSTLKASVNAVTILRIFSFHKKDKILIL